LHSSIRATVQSSRAPDVHPCALRVQTGRKRLPLVLQVPSERWMCHDNDDAPNDQHDHRDGARKHDDLDHHDRNYDHDRPDKHDLSDVLGAFGALRRFLL
jgi:hypothetical protein